MSVTFLIAAEAVFLADIVKEWIEALAVGF